MDRFERASILIRAMFVAAFTPGFLIYLYSLAHAYPVNLTFKTQTLSFFLMVVASMIVTLPCTFFVGLPLCLLAIKYDLLKWWSSLLSGLVAGMAYPVFTFFISRQSANQSRADLVQSLLLYGALGAVSGFAAFLTIRMNRQALTVKKAS